MSSVAEFANIKDTYANSDITQRDWSHRWGYKHTHSKITYTSTIQFWIKSRTNGIYGGAFTINQEEAGCQRRAGLDLPHKWYTLEPLAFITLTLTIYVDNTVISFFESSADDIEIPILHRLSTPDTILRRSCDASMIVQAVIDAIIDLAIPVSVAYQDILGELELDVLTQPSLKHTTTLYIVTSEITMMRSFVSPIVNLINALRDHKSNAVITGVGGRGDIKQAPSGVKISAMAQTYLGDVDDHIILITESLDNMRRLCDNMIDLIFNTISAYQNESMKQLTVVTIVFLPMSFLTGYFGMNFHDFPSINNEESYFWEIALPLAFVVIVFLMRDMLRWYFARLVQRRGISRSRKGRLQREAQAESKRNS
jgi:Mg2+ and Co2+ transporter CorA